MGHDLDDLQGQRSISLTDSPAQMKNTISDADKTVDSVPYLQPGSSLTVIGPDGNEMVVTVAKANEQPLHELPLQPYEEEQIDGTFANQGSSNPTDSVDGHDPLSRLSQYQINPKHTQNSFMGKSPYPISTRNPSKTGPHKFLTLKQKYDLCKWHMENPNTSLDDVIDHFEPLLGRRLPRSTLSSVLSKSDHFLSLDPDSPSTWTRKIMSKSDANVPETSAFEDSLYKWVWQEIQSGGVVTSKAIGDKAKQLANESGYAEFLYSPMWQHMFLKRFKLTDKIHHDN